MVDMRKYLEAAHGLVDELEAMLQSDDEQALWADVHQLGSQAWIEWAATHEDDVLAFVRATSSQRAKRRAWQDPILKRRLVLAAIRHIQYGAILLKVLENPCLSPGCSYRDTAAEAGLTYWDICLQDPPLWPLSGQSPFCDE